MASLRFAQTALQSAGSISQMLLDAVFPPRCPSCAQQTTAEGNFCRDCFARLHLIADPLCDCCGIPFSLPIEAESLCASCLAMRPHYTQARAAMVYDGVSAPLIAALKFQDQWAGLARHAAMMQAVAQPWLSEADLLIPVPLHWRRLLRRRYNQAALLAHAISSRCGVPCRTDLLIRARATRPQMELARARRLRNVRRAFTVSPSAADALHGARVVLIDDVMTTGATVDACARVLLRAGAREVRVLALARTVVS